MPIDWANYRREYNIIAANYSAVRYFVAPSKPGKWSRVLAQAIQLIAVQDLGVTLHALSDFRCILQWTNSTTIMISSRSYFMAPLVTILCMLCLIFKSCFKLIKSNYCMACYNNAVYIISSNRFQILIVVSWLQFYSQNPWKLWNN